MLNLSQLLENVLLQQTVQLVLLELLGFRRLVVLLLRVDQVLDELSLVSDRLLLLLLLLL